MAVTRQPTTYCLSSFMFFTICALSFSSAIYFVVDFISVTRKAEDLCQSECNDLSPCNIDMDLCNRYQRNVIMLIIFGSIFIVSMIFFWVILGCWVYRDLVARRDYNLVT